MRIAATIPELKRALHDLRSAGGTLGLVPTMGALHAGHLSLVEAAVQECDAAVATIFVNPTQFGPNEDFSRYPRTLEADLALLEAAGCALVFTPEREQLYPAGFSTWVTSDPAVEGILCGASRPGHFRGVLTIVAKLFHLIQPDAAWFGQKDFQQAWLIRRMVRDLDFPLEIHVAPTVREPDGLALSSRNQYLSPADRQRATVLWWALQAGLAALQAGAQEPSQVLEAMVSVCGAEPAFALEYAEVRAAETLAVAPTPLAGTVLLALAGRLGTTRLIDNALVQVPSPVGVAAASAEGEAVHVP